MTVMEKSSFQQSFSKLTLVHSIKYICFDETKPFDWTDKDYISGHFDPLSTNQIIGTREPIRRRGSISLQPIRNKINVQSLILSW